MGISMWVRGIEPVSSANVLLTAESAISTPPPKEVFVSWFGEIPSVHHGGEAMASDIVTMEMNTGLWLPSPFSSSYTEWCCLHSG